MNQLIFINFRFDISLIFLLFFPWKTEYLFSYLAAQPRSRGDGFASLLSVNFRQYQRPVSQPIFPPSPKFWGGELRLAYFSPGGILVLVYSSPLQPRIPPSAYTGSQSLSVCLLFRYIVAIINMGLSYLNIQSKYNIKTYGCSSNM